MFLLILTSLVWAFSFGLIKDQLTSLDPTAVAVLRLFCAAGVFLPCFRRGKIPRRYAWRFAAIGAVQFGLMYVLYLRAFTYLAAYEVVLFTIFTPLYIALIDALLERRWLWRHLAAALLAFVGAGVLLWHAAPGRGAWIGFGLMQLSNLCFAVGQLAWRRERRRVPAASASEIFVQLYAGAFAATLIASFFITPWASFHLTWSQAGVILYLGVIASGLGFFWWNLGALQVNAGTLAVMNNLKIPLGVAVSLIFFREHAGLLRLGLSCLILLAAIALSENWFKIRRVTA